MDEPTSFLGKDLGQAQAIRAYDWSSTSLGPIEKWPSALKAVVGMMLGSAFPKCIAWGPDLIMLSCRHLGCSVRRWTFAAT
ncbi:MAG TPA: hypothetical protein PKY87_13620 [Terricaulis sp.]|nr:hypothetical protein [Terricaulis sp.]